MRPIAERIKAGQDAADPQSYNRRFDTLKQVSESMEKLQTGRKGSDLPAVPTLDPGGDPDIWRSEPTVIAPLPDYTPEREREDRWD